MLRYGYAISLRGKALTCRIADYHFLEGLRPFLRQVTGLQKIGIVFGKSETCRASRRQSRETRQSTCPS